MRTVDVIAEAEPGEAWARHFARLWPDLRGWFLAEGDRKRANYLETCRALKTHMPELFPLWEQLTRLGGDSDQVARCLGLYNPTPFLSACSQAVWTRGTPALVRNYDYTSGLWEHTLMRTEWMGKAVLGMSDCAWGLLDGVNEDGLCVSLAFGGRKVVGEGFAIPLILRYVLQTCGDTAAGVEVLERVPSHMAYNVTLLDAHGRYATVFVSPDRPTTHSMTRVVTNHQGRVDWPEHAEATGSVDRLRVLTTHLESKTETRERFVQRFLEPPTYTFAGKAGVRTLYTAVYEPTTRSVEFHWPGSVWAHSLARLNTTPLTIPDASSPQGLGEPVTA